MIKLIATDLDGSLLSHGKISEKNLKAINYAKQKGIKLVLATGRDFNMIKPLIEEYNLNCFTITGNGAEFRDENGILIESAYFDLDKYRAVTKILFKTDLPFMVFTSDGFYSEQEPDYVRDSFIERSKRKFKRTDAEMEKRKHNMPCYQLQKISDVDLFLKNKPNLIKIEAFTIENLERIDEAKKELAKINDIAYLSSFDDNVEITHIKAQKGIILEEVCKKLNIDKDEVMIFGDGMNDISMFEQFKYSFAPKNSQEEILNIAYKVVSECEDDGFSEAVNEMINK